jgi:hypothetical protein
MTTYKNYSRIYHEVVDLTRALNNKRRELDTIVADFNDGQYGVEFTAHAVANIATRLEEMASENQNIYNDVFRPDSQMDALIIPSNLKSFVISLLSIAVEEKTIEKKASKSGGFEYHHTTNIKKWTVGKKAVKFTCVVENNTIKTGYFNYVDNDG